MSESKVDLGLLASNHMAVTQSQESMATMRERAVGWTTITGQDKAGRSAHRVTTVGSP